MTPGADAGPIGSTGALVASAEGRAGAGVPSCRAPGKGASFTLGNGGPPQPSTEGEADSDQELPFSTTIGNAVVLAGRFWVSAIDYRRNESHAVLAKIEGGVDRGTVLDLGRVYGDAEPPRVAVQGPHLLVVVADSDAGGRTLKIGRVSAGNDRDKVEWFDAVEQSLDDSPVFALGADAATSVVAWDELERSSRRGKVRWRKVLENGASASVAAQAGDKSKARAPRERSTVESRSTPADVDAEAPQLTSRPSGFWLGYLASTPKKQLQSVKLSNAMADGKSRGQSDQEPGDRVEGKPLVDLGTRGIELLPLDAEAVVSGRPIVVTAPGAHVVAFELKALPDGGAIVAYRDALSSPGIEEAVIEVAVVRPDGGVTRQRLEDERVGAGAPFVFVSASPRSDESVWVGAAGKSGEMQFAAFRPNAAPIGALISDPLLVGAEPLAREGSGLLVARTRGRMVELERLECQFEPAPRASEK